jgi:hypothetical protein
MQLLVSETPDGLLDLSDAFVYDPDAPGGGGYARPLGSAAGGGAPSSSSSYPGDLPRGPRRYRGFPWRETKAGDVLKGRAAEVTLRRMYFVPCGEEEEGSGGARRKTAAANGGGSGSGSGSKAPPPPLDLSELYAFDATERSLKRVPVFVRTEAATAKGKATKSAKTALVPARDAAAPRLREPVLRIGSDGTAVLEEAARLPPPAAVAHGFPWARPGASEPWEEGLRRARAEEDAALRAKTLAARGGAAGAALAAGGGASAAAAAAAEEEARVEELLEAAEANGMMEEMDDAPDVPAVDMAF